jgi:hypothetical protein
MQIFAMGNVVEKHFGLCRDIKYKFMTKIEHVTRIKTTITTMLEY